MTAVQKPETAPAKKPFQPKPPPTVPEAVAGTFREDLAKAKSEIDALQVRINDSKRLGQTDRHMDLERLKEIWAGKMHVLETATIPCADRIVAQAKAAAEAAEAAKASAKGKE